VKDEHLYFICNERRTTEDIVATFRVMGLMPELWDPATGDSAPFALYEVLEEGIRVPLQLEPYGSLFVIFRTKAQGDTMLDVLQENAVLISTRPFNQKPRRKFDAVVSNFNISLWAKPEMNIMLRESEHMEKVVRPYTDYYTLYPSPGQKLYGHGHATTGLAIGRNGISVWEHSKDGPLPVLAIPKNLEGWCHILLQYKEGVPVVYINGNKIGEGKKSVYTVHPSLGETLISEGASYYNGDYIEPELYTTYLSQDDIYKLASQRPERPNIERPISLPIGKHRRILFWKNGQYTLRKNNGKKSTVNVSNIREPLKLEGSWELSFPSGTGAPESIILTQLASLHLHEEPAIKYFSGTVTYTKDFQFPFVVHKSNKRIILDLGAVEVVAAIVINGKELGTLWKRPYQIDVTNAVQKGMNKLHIKVTNLWINRLIGDERIGARNEYIAESGGGSFERIVGGGIQKVPDWYIQGLPKPDDGRVTFTTWKYYTKDSPLVPSGLIGPVVLYTTVFVPL
jgi:hypothetical protein